MVTKITTHATDAKARLLLQYKESTKIKDLMDSLFLNEVQSIEDALYALLDKLNIDNMSGIQLDNIGDIIGQSRSGMADTIYKLFIKAKIGQNISCGDIERIISIWKLMSQAGIVQLLEAYPAQIDLMTDTAMGTAVIDIAFELIQNAAGAGIQVFSVGVFDPDEAFGFAESGPDTKGFGDYYDPSIGGKLAYIQAHA